MTLALNFNSSQNEMCRLSTPNKQISLHLPPLAWGSGWFAFVSSGSLSGSGKRHNCQRLRWIANHVHNAEHDFWHYWQAQYTDDDWIHLLFWCLHVRILNRLGQKGGQQFFNWHLPQSSTDSPWVGVGYHHTSQQGDGNSVGRLYVVDTMKHAEKPREKQPYSTGTCIA